MDLQHDLADISLKTISQVHRVIVQLSGGQLLGSAFGMPVAELHTAGRKSGLGWWRPTRGSAPTRTVPSATSRPSSSSRADRRL